MSIVSDSVIQDQLSCISDLKIDSLMEGTILPKEMPTNKEVSADLVIRYPQDYDKYGKLSDSNKSVLSKEI